MPVEQKLKVVVVVIVLVVVYSGSAVLSVS